MNGDVRPIIEARGLSKTFRRGRVGVEALRGIDLEVARGEFVLIVGPSGGGKTTLLSLIGGLDRPDAGALEVAGTDMTTASQAALDRLRREHVGFVFQFFNLLPSLTARDNVALALSARGVRPWRLARSRAEELLAAMGLSERAHHRPGAMSGGEQQRVAVARAVAGGPTLLLADEPTGDIDSAAAGVVMAMLADLNDRLGITIILVTHDRSLEAHADRVLEIGDGRITGGVRR